MVNKLTKEYTNLVNLVRKNTLNHQMYSHQQLVLWFAFANHQLKICWSETTNNLQLMCNLNWSPIFTRFLFMLKLFLSWDLSININREDKFRNTSLPSEDKPLQMFLLIFFKAGDIWKNMSPCSKQLEKVFSF